MPAAPASLDFLDPVFNADPVPVWHAIRAEHPMWWWPDTAAWLATGYAEVAQVMRDPAFSPSQRYWEHHVPKASGDREPYERFMENGLFEVGPDDHTRLRRLVSRAFTPAGVEAQRAFTHGLVHRILDQWSPGDTVDLAADYGTQIPALVIANLLGLQGADAASFRTLADGLVVIANPLASREQLDTANHSVETLSALLADAVALRRRQPADDLLTRLLAVEDEGDRLSHAELESLVIAMVIAGSDTTANQISLGAQALAEHPDELRLLEDDPTLIDGAVLEILRWPAAGKAMAHFAIEDVEVGDALVKQGQMAFFSVGAAHHDPAVFPDPDTFDIRRDNTKALPFGSGPHYCLGAALARLEIGVAIGELVRRFPSLTIDGEVVIGDHFIMRPVVALPVRLG